jgi:chorismate mutase
VGRSPPRLAPAGRQGQAPRAQGAPLASVAAVQDATADAVVRQMRDAIMDNDLKLLAAVNARLELVARLRAYKRSQGMEFVDQAREDWMHRYLAAANGGPLSDEGLHEIYGHLLDLTKRETSAEEP